MRAAAAREAERAASRIRMSGIRPSGIRLSRIRMSGIRPSGIRLSFFLVTPRATRATDPTDRIGQNEAEGGG